MIAQGVAWLSARQAAEYLGFVDNAGVTMIKAFYAWRSKAPNPPKTHWLGGRMRFRRVDLDRCVEVETEAPALALVGGRR